MGDYRNLQNYGIPDKSLRRLYQVSMLSLPLEQLGDRDTEAQAIRVGFGAEER